jgi:3-oxoacyl-[acyl-carrier protein] reductase
MENSSSIFTSPMMAHHISTPPSRTVTAGSDPAVTPRRVAGAGWLGWGCEWPLTLVSIPVVSFGGSVMPHSPPLTGRVALVTGANHGIGAATARHLASLGADVLVTYLCGTNEATGDVSPEYVARRADDAAGVVASIEACGRRAVAVEADLADPLVVPALFDRAEADLGPVDIVVNNASGWVADTFAAPDPVAGIDRIVLGAGTVDRVMAVDARAAALTISELAARLVARRGSWGRIVGLTSGGPRGFPSEVSYGAAKAAQENYTMSAAIELAELGVTANVVHPPVTDTGWVDDDVRAFVASSHELTHVAAPDEVAEVIGWLCTDAAALVSGNVIRLR